MSVRHARDAHHSFLAVELARSLRNSDYSTLKLKMGYYHHATSQSESEKERWTSIKYALILTS